MRKLSEINEGLFTNTVKRGYTDEVRKEDGHIYKKWGIPVKIKCKDSVFEYILHHLMFWRDDFYIDEGPVSHWWFSITPPEKHYSIHTKLFEEENGYRIAELSFDSYVFFMYNEKEYYQDDYNDESYEIDEEDYEKIINLIKKKTYDMLFILSPSFRTDDLASDSDAYGVSLYEFEKELDGEKAEKILDELKKEAKGFIKELYSGHELDNTLIIETIKDKTFLIMKVSEMLFDNYEQLRNTAKKIIES